MTTTTSVTLLPEQYERAERLAKQENRTLSELISEALRKYELMQNVNINYEFLAALHAVQQASVSAGLDKMTEEEIDEEITAYRRERDAKTSQLGR